MKNRFILFLIAVCGWFALIAQFYLIIENRKAAVPETVIRFFSYYTVLTNIIIAVTAAYLLLRRTDRFSNKFLTALLVYITVVGLVYNTVLRFLWAPEGLQWVVDELLHTIVPVLYLLYWIFYVRKEGLKWADVLPWLIYPLAYVFIVMIRGSFSGFYPYPFIDVTDLGYPKVLGNTVLLTGVFVFFSFLYVGLTKIAKK